MDEEHHCDNRTPNIYDNDDPIENMDFVKGHDGHETTVLLAGPYVDRSVGWETFHCKINHNSLTKAAPLCVYPSG